MRLAEAPYRARQFLHALFPRLDAGHIEQARGILGEGEMRLFLSMEKRDQRHGLRVVHHLTAQGQTDRELLAAALLHDCGKGHVPVTLRVLYVLAPSLVRSMAASGGLSAESGDHEWGMTMRRPVLIEVSDHGAAYRLIHHARLGAELAREAGSAEATVRYIEGRAAEHERDKISMLRAADDRS